VNGGLLACIEGSKRVTHELSHPARLSAASPAPKELP